MRRWMKAGPPLWAVAVLATQAGCPRGDGLYAPVEGAELRGRNSRFEWGGYSLGAAGDVNGDGRADLLMTSHTSSEGGRVALFLGPIAEGRSMAEAHATFRGEYGFSNLGDSLAHAGGCDVNGDGAADVLLGGPFADTVDVARVPNRSGDNAGRAYLFYGGPALQGLRSASAADVVFLGEAPSDTAGSTVACLGDLDGDGFDDIAIAAKGSARGGEDAGAVYLFYGRSSLSGSVPLAQADATLIGQRPYEQAGVAVAPAGDVTGDGREDVLVGAPNSDAFGEDTGVVYLVPGVQGRLSGQVSLGTATRLYTRESAVRLGWALDRAGDVNGDGIGDLVLGSSVSPVRPDFPGAAWLLLGGSQLTGEVDLDERGTLLRGEEPGDLAGIGVAGVGDMTGDGLADVVVGALKGRGSEPRAGRIYLVAGRRELPRTLELKAERWSAGGAKSGDHFGETVVAVGDVSGDGLGDFAVSAKSKNTGATASGAVNLFLSQRDRSE